MQGQGNVHQTLKTAAFTMQDAKTFVDEFVLHPLRGARQESVRLAGCNRERDLTFFVEKASLVQFLAAALKTNDLVDAQDAVR